MKTIDETHQEGLLSIEMPNVESQICALGIQTARDGRIWVCINGQAFIRFKPIEKEYDLTKKKTRKPKDYCVLPTCSRCYKRLHNDNAYKRPNGRFTTYCKECNVEEAIIKNWKKKSFDAIRERINYYNHMIELLSETIKRKE
jgi:hypothetical protein